MGRNGPRKKHPTLGVYDSSGDTPKVGRNQYVRVRNRRLGTKILIGIDGLLTAK